MMALMALAGVASEALAEEVQVEVDQAEVGSSPFGG